MKSTGRRCDQCGELFAPVSTRHRYCCTKCKRQANDQRFVSDEVDLSSGKRGALSELLVSADLIERGYDVFRAVSQSAPCDLVAMRGDNIFRIEVRTSNKKAEGLMCSILERDYGRADVFAIVARGGSITYYPEIMPGIPLADNLSVQMRVRIEAAVSGKGRVK